MERNKKSPTLDLSKGDVSTPAELCKVLEELMHHADREGTLEQQASAYWNAAITASTI